MNEWDWKMYLAGYTAVSQCLDSREYSKRMIRAAVNTFHIVPFSAFEKGMYDARLDAFGL